MSQEPPCPLCASKRTELYCRKDAFRILKCRDCRSGFIKLPEGTDPVNWYRHDYHKPPDGCSKGYDDYYAMAPALKRTFQIRLKELLALHKGAKAKMRLLDVGCGPGFFLDLASRHFEVTGVEPAKEAAAYARDVLRLDVIEAEFHASLYHPASFDVITLFDTIEHLADPGRTLRDLHSLMRPGGTLMITTGDFSSMMAKLSGSRWHLITPPDHLFFFTKKSLLDLLKVQGFKPLSVRYPHGHFTVDYLVERIVKSLRIGMAYRKRGKLRAVLRSFIVPMNLWDIMLVTAKKLP